MTHPIWVVTSFAMRKSGGGLSLGSCGSRRRYSVVFLVLVGIIGLAQMPVMATVVTYTGSRIQHVEGSATFEALLPNQSLLNYTEDGLVISVDSQSSGDNSDVYYASSQHQMVTITRADGKDFDALEMQVSDGWGISPALVWAIAYLNDVQVASFDIDVPNNGWNHFLTPIGFSGQFDELQIQAFDNATDRDKHTLAGTYGAISLDNVTFGTVPEPTSALLILLGLGGMFFVTGRRRCGC